MSVISSSPSSHARFPSIAILIIIILAFVGAIVDKHGCTIPRIDVVTVPSPPPPPNGCDENMRIDKYAKRFKKSKDATQILTNFVQSKLGNKRRVFTFGELLKTVKGRGNTIDPKFFEYVASCYGVGVSVLNEIFDSLTTCGGFSGKRPDFGKMLKEFKKPLPKFKPKAPAKAPRKPTNPKSDIGDDLWWMN